jgi:hypothetical protein
MVEKSGHTAQSVRCASLRSLVPDRRVRNIPEVVLVRRWVSWGSGNLEGEGWVKGGTRQGQFTSNRRPRWTIPVTARRVPSK